MIKLTDDIAILTNVSKTNIEEIVKLIEKNIAHSVIEQKLSNEFDYIDVGIGSLKISVDNNELRYSFIPSESLNNRIINSIKSNKSPIIEDLDKSVIHRIKKAYKELF